MRAEGQGSKPGLLRVRHPASGNIVFCPPFSQGHFENGSPLLVVQATQQSHCRAHRAGPLMTLSGHRSRRFELAAEDPDLSTHGHSRMRRPEIAVAKNLDFRNPILSFLIKSIGQW